MIRFAPASQFLLEKRECQGITEEAGLSKITLYRMSENGSNPTLENIGKLLSYINSLEGLGQIEPAGFCYKNVL